MLFMNGTEVVKNPVIMPRVYRKLCLLAAAASVVGLIILVLFLPDGDFLYRSSIASYLLRVEDNFNTLQNSEYRDRINLFFVSGVLNYLIGICFFIYAAMSKVVFLKFYYRFKRYIIKARKIWGQSAWKSYSLMFFSGCLYCFIFPYVVLDIDLSEHAYRELNQGHKSDFSMVMVGLCMLLPFHGLSVLMLVIKYFFIKWCRKRVI